MQTPSPTKASARACTAPAQPGFRLPLSTFRRSLSGSIEAKSADKSYELSLHPTHGVEHCPTQYWAFETRVDEHGREWHCTGGQFAVDDFGDLVEVAR